MSHCQFDGSIPEVYDAHLGPLLFDFSGADLAARVESHLTEGGHVLEVACGTGISTEHLRRVLPPATTRILATDLNEAMITFAQSKRGNLPEVVFEPADVLELPYGEQEFDAVVCQFGLMFFPDKLAGLAEMARVLKPGGLLAFNVWDSHEHNQVAEISHRTIAGFFPDNPPEFLKLPFGCAEIDPIKTLIQRVGFVDLNIHIVSAVIKRPDAHHVARGFVAGNPGIHEIRERASAGPEEIIEAVAAAVEAEFGPVPLQIPLQEIVYLATKPELG